MPSSLTPEPKPDFDIISSTFQGLKSDELSTRTRSAVELRDYVVARVSKTPADLDNSTTTFLDDSGINQRIFDLIHSRNVNENLGGLAGIAPPQAHERLESHPTADAEDAGGSSNNLTQVLQLELLASQTLGRILHLGNNPVPIPNPNSELEDSHVPETKQNPKPIFTERLLDFQISYHSNELVRFLNLGLAPGPDHLSGSTTSSIDILRYYASLLVLTQLLQYMYRDKDGMRIRRLEGT
ncbi:hypothetical protein D9757_001002 [Collybiopsis confluens]|uniref:Uncharacterized protein n=1 Tax=Collybiopsis confluens TaxID=2823264 RepID=A0A8H5MG13_9AGAR|nr:hypothetical protein D9757_001002 [Collybiopsis confluens]